MTIIKPLQEEEEAAEKEERGISQDVSKVALDYEAWIHDNMVMFALIS